MAIGDQQDFKDRLFRNLPKGWFPDDHPILDANLSAPGEMFSFIYSLWQYLELQTRIKTATEENLDLISCDFFGNALPRKSQESDDSFRKRILSLLFQVKATRPAMKKALTDLTGREPIIFEPWKATDTGGYAGITAVPPFIIGYNVAGRYGSGSYRYQAFIDVLLPENQGMTGYFGYNNFNFGYAATTGSTSIGGLARGWYGGISLIDDFVTDQNVYDVINSVKVFGTIIWVRIIRGDVE